jgi:molybdopterin-containing oxidoreductase family iron-sulfur binding subunit
MFNVYSNDTSDYFKCKKRRKRVIVDFKHVQMLVPTGAMKFGDVNDKELEITKLADDERMYHLLEHVGTKPM